MRSKLNYLIGVSLKRKIKTKWFLIANIILAIVIVGVINIDSIIKGFGGDFNEKQKIYLIDNTTVASEIFKQQITETSKVLDTDKKGLYDIVIPTKNVDELKKEIKDNKKEKKSWIVVMNRDTSNVLSVKVISEAFIETINMQVLTSAINNTKTIIAIQESNVSMEEINKIYKPITIEREILNEDKKSEDENMQMIMTTVFPVVILPFFMLTIFLVQMIGAEVNDEKTTRGMEIIISSLSPTTHFFSKVVAGNIFVLVQAILLLCYSGLGLGVRTLLGGTNIVGGLTSSVNDMLSQFMSSGLGAQMIYIIPLAIILMLLTFVAYSLLAGILASMTTNIEDFQQLQTPIMIVSLIGYYLSMMAGLFEGSLFIKIFAFIPFVSAILAPSLLVLGQIGIWEFVIAILLVIGTIYLLVKYGLRIYKVGILNYSSKDLWKKMFKAIKN